LTHESADSIPVDDVLQKRDEEHEESKHESVDDEVIEGFLASDRTTPDSEDSQLGEGVVDAVRDAVREEIPGEKQLRRWIRRELRLSIGEEPFGELGIGQGKLQGPPTPLEPAPGERIPVIPGPGTSAQGVKKESQRTMDTMGATKSDLRQLIREEGPKQGLSAAIFLSGVGLIVAGIALSNWMLIVFGPVYWLASLILART